MQQHLYNSGTQSDCREVVSYDMYTLANEETLIIWLPDAILGIVALKFDAVLS